MECALFIRALPLKIRAIPPEYQTKAAKMIRVRWETLTVLPPFYK
jgi:hypothetical protein